MKKIISKLLVCLSLILLLSSCITTVPHYNYKELVKASIKLGIDIDMKDNHRLYVESSHWIGVPHRAGGNSKRGTDCSGLTTYLYKKVYNRRLERNSNDQLVKDCIRINKNNLREGDLVFFHNGRDKKRATHVGVYLKNNIFIHTSTSKGVILSSLNEPYYKKHWLAGGRK